MKTVGAIAAACRLLLWSPGCIPAGTREGLHFDQIEMPPGFKVNLYARVPGARSMTLSPKGVLSSF